MSNAAAIYGIASGSRWLARAGHQLAVAYPMVPGAIEDPSRSQTIAVHQPGVDPEIAKAVDDVVVAAEHERFDPAYETRAGSGYDVEQMRRFTTARAAEDDVGLAVAIKVGRIGDWLEDDRGRAAESRATVGDGIDACLRGLRGSCGDVRDRSVTSRCWRRNGRTNRSLIRGAARGHGGDERERRRQDGSRASHVAISRIAIYMPQADRNATAKEQAACPRRSSAPYRALHCRSSPSLPHHARDASDAARRTPHAAAHRTPSHAAARRRTPPHAAARTPRPPAAARP